MGARDLLKDCRRGALLSACGTFRYSLFRRWEWPGDKLLFVMLNPSTGDAAVDDPTIRRCVTFAHTHGFRAIEVVNLFAFRATDPRDLARNGWQTGGQEADDAIQACAYDAKTVCVAWGAIGDKGPASDRAQEVAPMLRACATLDELQCLRITRSGYPQHPLYLPGDCRLQPYSPEAIQQAMHKGST